MKATQKRYPPALTWRCFVTLPWGVVLYVAQLPGEGGVCWGWSDDPDRARNMTLRDVARFRSAAADLGWRGANVTRAWGAP